MPSPENNSRSQVLRVLLALSVISCFAAERGFDRPRELVAPLLAPLSHSGVYVAGTIKRNLTDLADGGIDDQTAHDLLSANESLRTQLGEHVDRTLQRQVVAYEQLLGEYRTRLADLGQARQTLGSDFPCKLLPASVIGHDVGPYAQTRLLRPRGKPGKGDHVTTRELLTNRPTAIPSQMAVLSAAAFVGRIASSGAWTAHLQLLTDQDFRMRAYVIRLVRPDRDRTIRIVEIDPGSGREVLRERLLGDDDPPIPVNLMGDGVGLTSAAVSSHHAIEVGDYVVTMGDDGWLPMQVTVGTVSAVEPTAASPKHVQLRVAPAADLESLRRVCIVAPLVREGG